MWITALPYPPETKMANIPEKNAQGTAKRAFIKRRNVMTDMIESRVRGLELLAARDKIV